MQSRYPPYVEYSLTPLGRTIAKRLTGLIELVEYPMHEVMAARERYDAADTTA
jgi:DNA-binding HxlR family transcriptional regulator